MEYFESNGVKLAYEVIGEGEENIVFLNGIAMTIGHWKPLVDSLKGKYRILLHDFRGQLLSGKPDEPYSLKGHARELAALMDFLHMGKAHIAGTSYGSEVAMEFALLFSEKVQSLVLIDGVSELDPVLRTAVESWQLTAAADPRLFYRTIIPWNYSPLWLEDNLEKLRSRENQIASLPREYFRGFGRLCDAFLDIDLTDRLRGITAPTLVVVGEKDILKHRGFAGIIHREIGGSVLKVIDGAGHAVVIEQPATVGIELEKFWKS